MPHRSAPCVVRGVDTRAPSFMWVAMSVAQVDGEEERARRRIGREIDEPADLLASEVAHLGIHSRVVGPRHEIAAAELDAREAGAAEEALGEAGGNHVADGDLAQLHEG